MTEGNQAANPFVPMVGGKRWYDKDPRAGWAIELILNFPDSIQYQLCENLLTLMVRLRDQREVKDNYKSLGREGILALYRSRLKRRAYDHNNHTHQVLACMSVLHPDDQTEMVNHIAVLSQLVKQVIEIAGVQNTSRLGREIRTLIKTYATQGEPLTRQWIGDLAQRLGRVRPELTKVDADLWTTPEAGPGMYSRKPA